MLGKATWYESDLQAVTQARRGHPHNGTDFHDSTLADSDRGHAGQDTQLSGTAAIRVAMTWLVLVE